MIAHLRRICSDEVDRLGLVLLPLGCVGADNLADGHWMGQHPGHQPLQGVRDLVCSGIWLAGEFPPGNFYILSISRNTKNVELHFRHFVHVLERASIWSRALHFQKLLRQPFWNLTAFLSTSLLKFD